MDFWIRKQNGKSQKQLRNFHKQFPFLPTKQQKATLQLPTAKAYTTSTTRTAIPNCQEFRTQLLARSIKDILSEGIKLHWVHSGAQLADSLTKVMEATFLRETLRKGRYCLHDSEEVLKNRASARNRLKWLRSSTGTDQMYTKSKDFWSFGNVKRIHLISTNTAWSEHALLSLSRSQPSCDPSSCRVVQPWLHRCLGSGSQLGEVAGGITPCGKPLAFGGDLTAVASWLLHRWCNIQENKLRGRGYRWLWWLLGIREPLLPIHNIYIIIYNNYT